MPSIISTIMRLSNKSKALLLSGGAAATSGSSAANRTATAVRILVETVLALGAAGVTGRVPAPSLLQKRQRFVFEFREPLPFDSATRVERREKSEYRY